MVRESRREENQKLFRRGNESLHDAALNIGLAMRLVPFLCECADEDCRDQVEVTPEEWESVSSRPNHYLMLRGHPRSQGEEVVGSLREYEIALKPA
jgi:hypothetical protein